MNLKDRKWKEFFLIDIFPEIQRGRRLTKAKQKIGNTPYISSTGLDNGIDNFISNRSNVRVFEDCLTIANSGSVGSSFYQPYKFVASDHVTHLKNNQFNKYIYLFLSTITSRLATKYNFNREINDPRIKREKIVLPVSQKNESIPDWNFIERFIKVSIKSKEDKYKSYAHNMILRLSYKEILPLSEKKWKEFFLNDLFDIKSGVRLTKANMQNGKIPFIGAIDSNNGISNFVSNINASIDKNVLGVNYNGSVCEVFYHPYECLFTDDVKHLSFKKYSGNKFTYLFFKQIIFKQKRKYSYGYKFNARRMERQILIVPINDNDEPDYEYMEQYINNMMLKKYKQYAKE